MKINKTWKLAIVHDCLLHYGGGEKVLEILVKLFPTADLYTSAIDQGEIKKSKILSSKNIHCLSGNFFFFKKFPRLIQLFSPLIWRKFPYGNYDLVMSHGWFYMSHLVALSRKKDLNTKHIHYAIGPPQNLYEDKSTFFYSLIKLTYYSILRYFDRLAIKKVHRIIVVSQAMSDLMKKIYREKFGVMYPPVVLSKSSIKVSNRKHSPGNYFTYIGRLSKEKNVELIIKFFNKNGLQLVVIGDGKERKNLESIANSNIRFLGHLDASKINEISAESIATIHAARNDAFPLSLVESLGRGIPVIAYKGGGVNEIVIENVTGFFFRSLSIASLNKAINKLRQVKLSKSECRRHAEKFSAQEFKKNFKRMIKDL